MGEYVCSWAKGRSCRLTNNTMGHVSDVLSRVTCCVDQKDLEGAVPISFQKICPSPGRMGFEGLQ